MTTFVLVHGAWSGAHTFHLVRPLLRQAGHEVFTPSLTGLGERAHLASPQVNLSTHITDVVNTILYEDLNDIVLLGFSYGGMVVTGALAHVAERVRHLVYLDAFLPADGETALQLTGHSAPMSLTIAQQWLVPSPQRQYEDAAEAAFIDARRVPHPAGCFVEPVRLPRKLEDYAFTRSYIKATGEAPPAVGSNAFWDAAARVRSSPAWRYHEIATNHMIPCNRPKELVAMLLALV